MNGIATEPRRGQIWYADVVCNGIEDDTPKARPVVLVSNDANNIFSGYVTIVPLSTKVKRLLPTHVIVPNATEYGLRCLSVAKAEGMTLIPKKALLSCVGALDDDVMNELEHACLVQLGIERS